MFHQVFQELWPSVPFKIIPSLEGAGTITELSLAANGYRQKKRCTNMSMLCLDDESLRAEAAFMLSACAAPSIAGDWFLGYIYTVRDPEKCSQPSQREPGCGQGTYGGTRASPDQV